MRLNLQTTVLGNGLRVVTSPMPGAPSMAMGFWIGCGSRHEPEALNGIGHFIEHLAFKGTATRTAREISEAIEGAGGYCDAYTQEDLTCFHARVEAARWGPVFDLLAEMFRRPRYDPADIRRERAVIAEEIAMYGDQPHHIADDLMMAGLFPGHALGCPVTGTVRSLRRIGRVEAMAFRRRHYAPANTVVAFAGPAPHAACVRRARRALGDLAPGRPAPAAPFPDAVRPRAFSSAVRPTDQVQAMIGFRAFGGHDPRRYALKLLSVMLGETMSSRLFQTVREDHGLAYSVSTSLQLFRDTGLFAVEAGLDAGRAERALRLVFRELRALRDRGPSPGELRRARDYTVGQTRIAFETSGSRMVWAGEQLLIFGHVQQPADAVAAFCAVTAAQVRRVAADVLDPSRMSAALVGPAGVVPREAAFRRAAAG